MININWTKEIDEVIYQMELVEIRDKNYLVKFSAVPSDMTTGEDNISSPCLVELSSSEINLCIIYPKETYMFIKHSANGFRCYAIDFHHDRSNDPEYEHVSYNIRPIRHVDKYINGLREKPIEHDMNGCVVNTQSCVVHCRYFAKNKKVVFDFAENIYDKTVNTIRLWEEENCYE